MFVQFGTYYYSCEDKTKFNHLIRVAVHGSGSINELLLNDNLLTELVYISNWRNYVGLQPNLHHCF